MTLNIDGKWQYKLRVFGVTLYQRSGKIASKIAAKAEATRTFGPVLVTVRPKAIGVEVVAAVGPLVLFNKHLSIHQAIPFAGSGNGYSITGTVAVS